ncbi:hypothetical protein [Vibrio sp. Hal054]|uniref:hypothetical protein n=1 Tax=Vibrio sp. Hal054 TaxID=3035158 RepID=UPI00301E0E43
MWVVCQLRADRTQPKHPTTGEYPLVAIPVVEFGKHKTRDAAVCELVLHYHPENKDSPLEHLKRMSKEFLRGSMRTHKIQYFP